MYINGQWHMPEDAQVRDVINPANGKVIAHAVEGTVADTRKAIESARTAFDTGPWPHVTNAERSHLLFEIAEEIEGNLAELARLEMLDNGKPLREAKIDVQDAAECFRYYASIIRSAEEEIFQPTATLDTLVVREPIGVCGLIVPWNFPLLMSVWKFASALAAGNTIVFKPSEVTPITAMKLFEIFDEVGLPDGVANLVMGEGATVGNEIATSHDVDMISFTGGTETGR